MKKLISKNIDYLSHNYIYVIFGQYWGLNSALDHDPPICVFPCSWNDRCMTCALTLVEMGVSQAFCLNWPRTVILPNSVSQVARITGVSHCIWRVIIIIEGNSFYYDY
jgi:hypothetical protein